jgi:hypothetical protein
MSRCGNGKSIGAEVIGQGEGRGILRRFLGELFLAVGEASIILYISG